MWKLGLGLILASLSAGCSIVRDYAGAGGGEATSSGTSAQGGSGTSALGIACSEGNECASGFCASGVCCDAACDGACEACTSALTQSGVDGTCGPRPEGFICQSPTCTEGVKKYGACSARVCVEGQQSCDEGCMGDLCVGDCVDDTSCALTEFCDPIGNCTLKKIDGEACTAPSECGSNQCVDGVCCNTGCDGLCEACIPSLTGVSAGTCAAITAGVVQLSDCPADSPQSCGSSGTCNGAGACSTYGAETQCAGASCSGSTLTPASFCDGSGTCVPSTPQSCGYFLCEGAACGTSCTGAGQCVSGASCLNSACTVPNGNGTACGSGAECTSGFCVEGVCCDSTCGGSCQSCLAAKSGGGQGFCTAIPNGQDPDDECSDQGAGSCGTNGACNGANGCAAYPAGTTCAGASCSGTTLTQASACSGGSCPAGLSQSCGNYICEGAGCRIDCTVSGHCAPGLTCACGACVAPKPLGLTCTCDGECASGFCRDGFCCDTNCSGLCQHCGNFSINGAGSCGDIESGDPNSECIGSSLCCYGICRSPQQCLL